jgi:hypothetical protein
LGFIVSGLALPLFTKQIAAVVLLISPAQCPHNHADGQAVMRFAIAVTMPTTFHFSVNATLVDKCAELLISRKGLDVFAVAAAFLRHRATCCMGMKNNVVGPAGA